MKQLHVAIIGAGAGGLAAAIDLARSGVRVTVLEKAATPGGKIRIDPAGTDSGPTVFTMRWIFDSLFADAGTSLDSQLTLRKADILARHAWSETERLDLFADPARTEDAIAAFAGRQEADGYRAFRHRAQRMFEILDQPFMRAPKPSALSLTAQAGIGRMRAISPFSTLWSALGEHFRDPRLRQLFGRYATYSGSSPFLSPATLMLIAHAEAEGVWLVEGGMIRLTQAMAQLATNLDVEIRCNMPVTEVTVANGAASGVHLDVGEHVEADAVICNADYAALAAGLFGPLPARAVSRPSRQGRSLSALTWAVTARTAGFPLERHTVFFSRKYKAEFDAIFRHGRFPDEPTVYVCAQDRPAPDWPTPDWPAAAPARERLLILANAPANGDETTMRAEEIEECATRTFGLLHRCGLTVEPETMTVTTPGDFNRLFPATGGGLYGQAVHGSMAAFRRPGARTTLPGLYLAGGSVHPGPGVPMAVMSGRLAAAALMGDLARR